MASIPPYIWILNPISGELQLTINPESVANIVNTSPDIPARPGDIVVFGSGNKIEDSGFYLNETGQIVKVSGGYFA